MKYFLIIGARSELVDFSAQFRDFLFDCAGDQAVADDTQSESSRECDNDCDHLFSPIRMDESGYQKWDRLARSFYFAPRPLENAPRRDLPPRSIQLIGTTRSFCFGKGTRSPILRPSVGRSGIDRTFPISQRASWLWIGKDARRRIIGFAIHQSAKPEAPFDCRHGWR